MGVSVNTALLCRRVVACSREIKKVEEANRIYTSASLELYFWAIAWWVHTNTHTAGIFPRIWSVLLCEHSRNEKQKVKCDSSIPTPTHTHTGVNLARYFYNCIVAGVQLSHDGPCFITGWWVRGVRGCWLVDGGAEAEPHTGDGYSSSTRLSMSGLLCSLATYRDLECEHFDYTSCRHPVKEETFYICREMCKSLNYSDSSIPKSFICLWGVNSRHIKQNRSVRI